MEGKIIAVTGASRGIGRAIVLACAQQGAHVVIMAKTKEPHPKLSGTIFTVAQEAQKYGIEALPIVVDVRDDQHIQEAAQKIQAHFGRLDVLVNNASAISLTDTLNTPMKKFDLMFAVNVRATFACSQACIPLLQHSAQAHILTLSPPLNMDSHWFKSHLAYTMSKYGMSMCTLGLAEELRSKKIAVNSLWPKTIIATAAIEHHFPPEYLKGCRTPEIVADAAVHIFKQPPSYTGQFLLDEQVLKAAGMTDFSSYAVDPTAPLINDLYC